MNNEINLISFDEEPVDPGFTFGGKLMAFIEKIKEFFASLFNRK